MEKLNTNVVIDIVSLLVILCVWLLGQRLNSLSRVLRRIFSALLIVITLVFMMDMPAWLHDGGEFKSARTILWICNTLYYSLQIIYCFLWLLFSDYWCSRRSERIRGRAVCYAIPMVLELALIAMNLKTGWIFTISDENVYVRGNMYLLNLIPYYFYILSALFVALREAVIEHDPYLKRRVTMLAVFMFLPICSTIIVTVSYGVSLLWPFTALSLLMVCLETQQAYLIEQKAEAAHLRAELTESRVQTMMSQIQPHFLYNTLTAIYDLCDTDPKQARAAVGMFSNYLRFNLDSVETRRPVSFKTELSHVMEYSRLEKMRFEDKLDVEFDIKADSFMLPPLTIQPLVENAVKHGVGKAPQGGRVEVSTWETPESFCVSVCDNGVGFDVDEVKRDGRSHLGIDSVRGRLKALSNAELRITSKKGAGTTALIIIPKGT